MVKNWDIICRCYINLTDAIEKYQDNWICDETWVRVISARYPDVIKTIGFSREIFNRAISRHASQCGTQNDMGIFIQQFSTSCPYDSGQWRKVSYFYRQIIGKPPADPASVHDITDVHVGRIQRWGVNTRGLDTSVSREGGTGGRLMAMADNDDDDYNRVDNDVQNTPMRAAGHVSPDHP